MNKRNSILESLSEGMLSNKQINTSKATKSAIGFIRNVNQLRKGNIEDIYGYFKDITENIATKYTKTLSKSYHYRYNEYPSIYCDDCEILFSTNGKDELYVFVENPYSNEYSEEKLRDNNVLIYQGGSGATLNMKYFIREMVNELDGSCTTIDRYVEVINDYLKGEGFTLKDTTLGFEGVSSTSVDDILFGKYTLAVNCLSLEFFDTFTDDLLVSVVDVKSVVYLQSTYTKLKLPTLGIRITIKFDSSDNVNAFMKAMPKEIKGWVNSIKLSGTSLVVEVY